MVDPTLDIVSNIIESISNDTSDHDLAAADHDIYKTIDDICQTVDQADQTGSQAMDQSVDNLAEVLIEVEQLERPNLEINTEAPEQPTVSDDSEASPPPEPDTIVNQAPDPETIVGDEEIPEVTDLDRQMLPSDRLSSESEIAKSVESIEASEVEVESSESSVELTVAEDQDNQIDDVEMPLFDHLEELRNRIFYAIATIIVGIIGCFVFVNKIVHYLEIPAQGVKFLQLSPGEYFFVSIKVAGYSGLLVSAPMILYQVVRFVLPGLTKKEKKFVAPIIFGSSILFVAGIGFAYIALIPAALNFFINYGGDVVEQLWSIDRYFEFVLLLLFSTGLAFQIPIVQALLGVVGIVSSRQMLSGWRYVIVGALVLGGILTPSTDPLTQSLLAGAVGGLYFGGIGLVKLMGR